MQNNLQNYAKNFASLQFSDEFNNFQTKLIRVGHNLHLKLGVQILGCRSSG